jgi:transcriptional regulator with XRE-family HTH domain
MNEPPVGRRGKDRVPLHLVPDLPSGWPEVHLGERLRAVRERAGLSQEKAAVASGISRNTLVTLEKARFGNPKLGTLLRLMRTYKLRSIEELLGPVPSARLAAAWEAEEWNSREESS